MWGTSLQTKRKLYNSNFKHFLFTSALVKLANENRWTKLLLTHKTIVTKKYAI